MVCFGAQDSPAAYVVAGSRNDRHSCLFAEWNPYNSLENGSEELHFMKKHQWQ